MTKTRSLPPPEIVLGGAVTAAVLGFWSSADGGFAETVWYPTGILLLALLAVLAWSAPGRRLGRWTRVAVAGFAGLTAWSFLSILWAGDPGTALTGANRTLVFLVVLVVVARQRWQPREAAAFLVVWALTTTVVGVVSFAYAAYGAHALTAFSDGRLSIPIDYANANAALFVLAAWPLVAVAQSARMPAGLRVLCLGAAGVAAELAILAQSKGAVIATAVTVVLFVLVARRHARAGVPIVVVAAIVAILHGPLFDVYVRLHGGPDPVGAIRAAAVTMAISFGCLVAAGAATVALERRVFAPSPRLSAVCARFAGAVTAAAVVAGIAVVVVELGSPASIARRGWHAFKHPAETSTASSHFVTGAGNHRYDFWRVAAHQFEHDPLLGRGVDNFAADYVRLRRSSEQPTYPHSLEARLLGGTGLVGFGLFIVFAVGAFAACIAAARSAGAWAVVGLAGATMFAYWLVHGSVDWLWEFPALSGPAVAAVACSAGAEQVETAASPSPRRAHLAGGAAVAAGVAAAVALVPAWLAARYIAEGVSTWRSDPSASYAALDRAAGFNRLSDQPDVVAGTIAERRRDWPRARLYFSRALRRNPDNWYSQLEQGVAQAKLGEHTAALASLRRASRLDPLEPTVRDVLTAVVAGRPFSVKALDAQFVDEGNVSAAR